MNTLAHWSSLQPDWRVLFVLSVFCSLLTGCMPLAEDTTPPPWRYADLRILAASGTSQDTHHLVSLYIRRYRSDLQIRLDLLDYAPQDEFDLYLAIDTHPGGASQLPISAQTSLDWDLLLIVPSSGSLAAMKPDGEIIEDLRLRVARNPSFDTLIVSFDQDAVGSRFRIQALLTESGASTPISTIGPVHSDSRPSERLPVTIAFWNTFHAYTPSQALRHLDGAHTGPSSDRHGLRGLLDAVESARFPVVLLDIKTPTSLSALEYVGALNRVRHLASQGLLILPDIYPLHLQAGYWSSTLDWAQVESATRSRQVQEDYGLYSSPYLYTAVHPGEWSARLPKEISQHKLVFYNPTSYTFPTNSQAGISLDEDNHVINKPGNQNLLYYRWQAYRVMDLSPLSQELHESHQATYSGPSLEVRRALLGAATDQSRRPFVLLGGDLSQATWGNPTAALQTLQYLKSRPWIQPMTPSDLAVLTPDRNFRIPSSVLQTIPEIESAAYAPSSPDGIDLSSGINVDQIQLFIFEELKRTTSNTASKLAWQAYEALLAPPILPHPDLAPLRANYLGQIGHLLAATIWEESGPGAFCTSLESESLCIAAQDLDWDREDEYLMASQDLFLLFESRGGYLTTAFWRSPDGAHQFIAPSSQFIVGMGDPMIWDPGKGVAGDPAQYRGAFSDIPIGLSSPSWANYDVEINPSSLTFIAPDGSLRKSFSISPGGFTASYSTGVPLNIQIPLAVDPSLRFSPGWRNRYTGAALPGGWVWGLTDGIQVQILSSGDLSFSAFSDSSEYMSQPENPDFDFPPGHFLPFPMALGEIRAEGNFDIELSVIVP
jgi:hypothetical protein